MGIGTATGATRGSSLGSAVFSEILKEYYRPAVVDQLNSKTVLMRMLGRRSEGVEGKYFVTALNTGRNYGFGYAAERGRLPDPQAQQYKQCRYHLKYSYGRIKFTGPAASASRSDRGSFVRIMDAEVQGLARDIQHNDNRILFGNGSGRLCRVVSGSGAGPWTVTNPGGITSTALGTQYLDVGMRVAVCDPGGAGDTAATAVGTQPTASFSSSYRSAFIGTIDRTAGTVSFVDGNNSATTLTKSGTELYLYIANDWSTDLPGTSFGRGHEPNGLAAIVSDSDPIFQDGASASWETGLGEVPVATNPVWKAPVISNGGVAIPFAPDMFQQAMDLVDITSDSVPDVWVTSHGIRRQYLNTLVAAKRFPNTMELDGGFKALTYDGRPIVVDKDCTRGRIYGLALESIFMAYETDYNWIDQDGAVLHRMVDEDAFQAAMYRYWNLATDARNRNVLIEDIVDV